jgi:hypothetical protein
VLPLVAIDVGANAAPAAETAVMVEACSGAVKRGRCALAADAEPSSSVVVVAIVMWQDADHMAVRLRVGMSKRADPGWIERDLTFGVQDDLLERYRTAGLAIATLAGDLPGFDVPVEAPPVVAPPAPSVGSPPVFALDAGALSRVQSGVRLGGWARASFLPPGSHWIMGAGIDYSERPGQVADLQFVGATVGLGHWWSLSDSVRPEVRAFVLAQHAQATAANSVSGESDSAGVWHGGFGGAVDLVWQPWNPLGFVVGIDVFVLNSGTLVRSEDIDQSRISEFGASGRVGLRLALGAE